MCRGVFVCGEICGGFAQVKRRALRSDTCLIRALVHVYLCVIDEWPLECVRLAAM